MNFNLLNNKFFLGQVIAISVVFGLVAWWGIPRYFNIQNGVSLSEVIKFKPDLNPREIISVEREFAIDPVFILLVPGHDKFSKGGFFRELYEEQITLELAEILEKMLKTDGRFKVVTTRDFNTGDYTEEFAGYFSSAETQIQNFHLNAKKVMQNLFATGTLREVEPVIEHNNAGKTSAFRLYGINKWANDNKVDLALHIHFNDHPRKFHDSVGKYTGFSIFVPEKQFTNASSSRKIAEQLVTSLSLVSATSTFPLEAGIIVESQDLIATGANNSQTHPAVLVEYGYIYEPQYYIENLRTNSLSLLAKQTYRSLLKSFFSK